MSAGEQTPRAHCPDCGAFLDAGQSCADFFHQMLFWENEDPSRGAVHHLMVLCYYLQHPRLYSIEGLIHGRHLLADFVERGLSPSQARQQNSARVDSGRREWAVTARPGNEGAYERPIAWTMTAADIVAGGAEGYVENIQAWAVATHAAIRRLSIDKQ